MGAGLLETREPKSVTVGIRWRGQWDVLWDRGDERELEVEVVEDLVVDSSKVLKFELGVPGTEPFKEHNFVVVCYDFTVLLTLFPFFEIKLTDTMRSTDVSTSRVSGSHTRMFPFPFHMSLYFTVMDCRLVYAYHSVLRLPVTARQLVCRVVIPGLMTLLPFTTVCTCTRQSCIYMVGDEDSFLIFNLLCNHPTSATCEIPRTLLVPSSSLVKATALRPVERSSFAFLC